MVAATVAEAPLAVTRKVNNKVMFAAEESEN